MRKLALPNAQRITFGTYATNPIDSPREGSFEFCRKHFPDMPKGEINTFRVHYYGGKFECERLTESEVLKKCTREEELFLVNQFFGTRFLLLEFNHHRYARGKEAAKVMVDDAQWLWMSAQDLHANIENFGAHPELLRALRQYGESGAQYYWESKAS
ncbi:hypothetical protein [Vibrio europaeus]|uniref:hypothetical protein n=1 Tax=Vibrio europaeus TaxID=300876 RepID=UPI00233EA6D6|nr:hypothetical protein [Vibrio europaeus]MDC5753543.1 hypothetical protein [Vibrio europaeus]MDC5816544.1 hypothetical protein [Vibrio europaeus]